MLFIVVEYTISLNFAAPLPFYGGDNRAPAVSASCVWPELVEPLPVSTAGSLQVVVVLLTLQVCQMHTLLYNSSYNDCAFT